MSYGSSADRVMTSKVLLLFRARQHEEPLQFKVEPQRSVRYSIGHSCSAGKRIPKAGGVYE